MYKLIVCIVLAYCSSVRSRYHCLYRMWFKNLISYVTDPVRRFSSNAVSMPAKMRDFYGFQNGDSRVQMALLWSITTSDTKH